MILVTVSANPSFHSEVRNVLEGHFAWEESWELSFADGARLRSAETNTRYLLVMDFNEPSLALAMSSAVDGRPQFATIAVGTGGTREDLLRLMQAGIRDVLPGDSLDGLLGIANRAAAKLASGDNRLGDLYAFVPAKPGCGATTLATNATAVAASLTGEPTLLLDFDIRLGVTSFLLKLEGSHTIVDALQQADRLDADLWSNLVARRQNLHVLGSGPVDFAQTVPWERFSAILDYALRTYASVSVDLPRGWDCSGRRKGWMQEVTAKMKVIFLRPK